MRRRLEANIIRLQMRIKWIESDSVCSCEPISLTPRAIQAFLEESRGQPDLQHEGVGKPARDALGSEGYQWPTRPSTWRNPRYERSDQAGARSTNRRSADLVPGRASVSKANDKTLTS